MNDDNGVGEEENDALADTPANSNESFPKLSKDPRVKVAKRMMKKPKKCSQKKKRRS